MTKKEVKEIFLEVVSKGDVQKAFGMIRAYPEIVNVTYPSYRELGLSMESLTGNRWTVLMEAAFRGDLAMTRLLILSGADPQARTNMGYTALMASSLGKYRKPLITKLLLEQNVAVDASNRQGQTALMLAAAYGNSSIVKPLIEQGASIHKKDGLGQTPLAWAASNDRRTSSLLLIRQGAHVNERTHNGMTPLMLAASKNLPKVVKILVNHGADLTIQNHEGKNALQLASDVEIQAYLLRKLKQPTQIKAQHSVGNETQKTPQKVL